MRIWRWGEGREKREEKVHMDYQQPSWAAGRGRVGWKVGQVTSMAVLGSVDKLKTSREIHRKVPQSSPDRSAMTPEGTTPAVCVMSRGVTLLTDITTQETLEPPGDRWPM